jgi:hypothetical protein
MTFGISLEDGLSIRVSSGVFISVKIERKMAISFEEYVRNYVNRIISTPKRGWISRI